MAFNKKTWKDRLSEFATRRILTNQDTQEVSVVEVARSEGTIYQQGDAFSAENMNDLEDRIEDAIENVTAVDGPMTDAAYDALTEAEKMDGTIRVVGSENEDDMMAAAVTSYDNTDSGLQADDVQGAIDEINQNLTEKVNQYSDTTYSVVKGLGVDTTNKKLGLIIEGEGGADTLFPFSGGSPFVYFTWTRVNNKTATLMYRDASGNTTTQTLNTSSGTVIDDDTVTISIVYNSNANYYISVTFKEAGTYSAAMYYSSGNAIGYVNTQVPVSANTTVANDTALLFYHSTNKVTTGMFMFLPG